MNISPTAPLDALVQEKIAPGFYNNASEVVREALRLMHERDQREAAQLERLRAKAVLGFEALERGQFSTKTVAQIAAEAVKRHNKRS
jgi:antitoxin ParD1/3/4